MLSISTPKRGKDGGYYLRYYDEHSNENGLWLGSGADALGLPPEIRKTHFTQVLNGLSPDGTRKLVQNAGASDRQAFWDLTLSAPKAVSVLYGVAPELRPELRQALNDALKATLHKIERDAGLSRRGKGGKEEVSAKLTFGVFFHETSRRDDPQLHFHCTLMNVGVRQDGTTGALKTETLFDSKVAIGTFFREQLGAALERRLGLELEHQKLGFGIKGVPEKLCVTLSKRRKDIKTFLSKHGLEGGIAAKNAALKTRSPKRNVGLEELTALWRSAALAHGFVPEEVKNIIERGKERLKQEKKAREPHEYEAVKKVSEEPRKNEQRKRTKQDAPVNSNRKNKRRYVRALWEAQDKIFPEKQTKARLVRVANRLASEHEVKRTDAVKEVSNLKLPVQKKYFRIEYVPLFRASPVFALRKIRVPRIVLRDKARKWGKISSKVSLVKPLAGKSLSIAIQRRKLFPKAPKWNPVSKLSFPAVRIRKDATRLKPVAKVLKPEEREQKRRLRH